MIIMETLFIYSDQYRKIAVHLQYTTTGHLFLFLLSDQNYYYYHYHYYIYDNTI